MKMAWKSALRREPVDLLRPNPFYLDLVGRLIEAQEVSQPNTSSIPVLCCYDGEYHPRIPAAKPRCRRIYQAEHGKLAGQRAPEYQWRAKERCLLPPSLSRIRDWVGVERKYVSHKIRESHMQGRLSMPRYSSAIY